MIKRLHSTLFYVADLARTADFYEKLGFPVQRFEEALRVKIGDFTLAFLDENKTPIKNESGAQPKGLGIYTDVEVDDVDAYFKSLQEKGIRTSTEPRDWPWGKREFVVRDPDRYKLVFYSPLR